MAGFTSNGGTGGVPFNDIEAPRQALASTMAAKDIKKLQNVAFKTAISILAITSGGILISPVGYLRRTAHRVLAVAYVVVMFISFTLGLVLLLISIPHRSAGRRPSLARNLMLVNLALVHVGVAIGTSLAVIEDA